jgi:hypothetical protein
MGLRDRLEQHWFVVLLFVVAVAVGTTWSVLNEVLVRPRDEEFARLQRRMQELEAKEQARPYPPDLRPSESSLRGRDDDKISGAAVDSEQEPFERDTATRDSSTASGPRGIVPSPNQARDAPSNIEDIQTESPTGGSVEPASWPSFETESYRLTVEDMKKSGKTVRITMMLEAIDEGGLSFRAGEWYLLDESGERWNELKRDPASVRNLRSGREGGRAMGAPPALMGVHLVSGTKAKDNLTFNATGSGKGSRFTLVGLESQPQSEREIIFRGLTANSD